MKTEEELNALKEEVEALSKKLAGLTEEELAQISGGFIPPIPIGQNPFRPKYDGSEKTVKLNIAPDRSPEGYDCSGVVS